MTNRITAAFTDSTEAKQDEIRQIGEILKELLADYERRFPEIKIMMVETPTTAV